MKTNIYYLLLAFALPLMAMQCEKDKHRGVIDTCRLSGDSCELAKLPPLTTTGENTFGCLVNGQAFLPKDNQYYKGLNFDYYQSVFSLIVSNHNSSNINYKILSFGGKQLDQEFNTHENLTSTYAGNYCDYYGRRGEHDTLAYNGELFFERFDTINRIFSGTFHFTFFPNSINCDTIFITHGRFDVKY
jgi:hypothetical protein